MAGGGGFFISGGHGALIREISVDVAGQVLTQTITCV